MKNKQTEKSEQYANGKSKQGTSQKEMSAKFPEPSRGSFNRNSSKQPNAKGSKKPEKE